MSIRNQGSVATHASGSIIDLVAAEPSLPLDIDTSWLQEEELRSDHAFLLCSSSTATIPILKQQQVGVARWGFGAGWEEASEAVSCSLKFAAAWAACALNDRTLRSWTAQGKCRGTRLNILDRVVWRRSVLLTLAGHVRLNRPRQSQDLAQELWPLMAADGAEDFLATEASEDVLARLRSSLHAERVAKFTNLSAYNQSAAQAYLSNLLKPKELLQTRLSEEGTGRQLTDFETLEAIANDVVARGETGHRGVPAFDAWVQSSVAKARAEALASTLSSPTLFVGLLVLSKLLDSVQPRKASAQLPRQAVAAASSSSRVLTWLLINLFFCPGFGAVLLVQGYLAHQEEGPCHCY